MHRTSATEHSNKRFDLKKDGVSELIRNITKLLRKNNLKQDMKAQNESKPQDPLNQKLEENEQAFRAIYKNCADVIFRSFMLFGNKKALIIYIEGLSDTAAIETSVLAPLMQETSKDQESLSQLLEQKLPVSKVKMLHSFAESIESIQAGYPLLLISDQANGFSLGLAKWEKRNIEEPAAESSVRGPREGFNESLQVSTSQLRRIIKSPALKIHKMKIGSYTQTTVALAYIEGLADQSLIDEVTKRLNRIQIDGILESEYIEEFIEDNPYSPFPQLMSTERPDIASAHLLEGRVTILVEGSPFVLIAPITFFSLLQSQEDYYQRFLFSTLIRWLRYGFLGISLLLPSLYVAVTTFHQEMIPDTFLLSIAAAREMVPFPALVEVLIMEITFEALREAGVRLPKQIGSAVSIVGALVIGQSAVQAGLVSTPMIIVVAITGIASFMLPRYITGIAVRMLRFPIILLAGTLGLFGIVLGILFIVIHLCTLHSFGVPYLAPLAPFEAAQMKDVLWRAPLWRMNTRPHFTGKYNEQRQTLNQANQAPKPQRGGET